MKNILYLQTGFGRLNRLMYESVSRHAREQKWHVHPLEFSAAMTNRRPPTVKEVLEFWHPDGCFADCCGSSAKFKPIDFGEVPVVFLDCDAETRSTGLYVASDAKAFASAAARELLSIGFKHFAYIAWPDHPVWDVARGKAFTAVLAMNGCSCGTFTLPAWRGRGIPSRPKSVESWLKRLSKSCGIFAANDVAASVVVESCINLGIAVPDEVAIVGVDNDLDICEGEAITITSIEQNREEAGSLAVKLLKRRFESDGKNGETALFGVSKVVRRASANGFRLVDSRVVKAVEFIRCHACEEIGVPDVVREMGCSRRLAFLRFGKCVGHPIGEEIHRVRMERAKELLADRSRTISQVALLCGYSSDIDFRRVFKRRLGHCPSEEFR